jgi:hypothetical protein
MSTLLYNAGRSAAPKPVPASLFDDAGADTEDGCTMGLFGSDDDT